PTLQLDIANGSYDHTTDTIMSPGKVFTLYAYLIPNSKNTLSDRYYVSMAVEPMIDDSMSIGSFNFDTQTVNVTGDMVYGVPPLEAIASLQGWDSGDLSKHGMFPTYFAEYEFGFNDLVFTNLYNTQDRAMSGDPVDLSYNGTGNRMYYVAFDVDTTNLSNDYVIHFDLYNTALKRGGDIDVTQFAPFSHDAESTNVSVPEPSLALLLGSGLTGLWLWRRRSNRM
ncbi:MAG: choice-of-anchor N protein, partial [Deltaproteobacteria bacterium]|nr:choice-of-anchor N protein [Deltaproteobacteria bacterium]